MILLDPRSDSGEGNLYMSHSTVLNPGGVRADCDQVPYVGGKLTLTAMSRTYRPHRDHRFTMIRDHYFTTVAQSGDWAGSRLRSRSRVSGFCTSSQSVSSRKDTQRTPFFVHTFLMTWSMDFM